MNGAISRLKFMQIKFFKTQSSLDSFLILVNALLISIWVLRETIALRNILLVLGAIVSLVYLYKIGIARFKEMIGLNKISSLPLLFIFCLFLWTITHFLFFSLNPELQFKELRSTWLRSFLAWIMGIVCALVIIREPKKLIWLGLGLISNFIGLFIEYLPLAITQQKISNVMPVLDNYLQGKIFAVCFGLIFLGGLLGAYATSITQTIKIIIKGKWIFYSIACVVLILYSYIFIIDTRNGFALSVLIFLSWGIWAITRVVKRNGSFFTSLTKLQCVIAVISMMGLLIFTNLHVRQNPGWLTTVEDASIAFQIDKYPNWKNPAAFGYPEVEPGKPVKINTYERAAWFVAGLSVVPDRLLGDGSLKHAFGRAIKERYPESNLTTSHSAWLDFSLSLGIPGIVLLLGAYLIIFIRSFDGQNPFNHFVRWISLATLMVYAVAELFNEVAFELLIYYIGFLATLLLAGHSNILLNFGVGQKSV
ncbi:MAG: hypothetical protein K9J38_10450 [Polynucleobacter sp.]|nr:hypothetical protein [Polynucleobacter sp.]